jgi:hypothetical protein
MNKRRGKNTEKERERSKIENTGKHGESESEQQNQKLGRERLELSTSGFLLAMRPTR